MHTMQIMQTMQNKTTETIEYMPLFLILNAYHHIRNESTLIYIWIFSHYNIYHILHQTENTPKSIIQKLELEKRRDSS